MVMVRTHMRGLMRFFRRSTQPLGQRGEDVASGFLKRAGFRIIERNLIIGDDEADILAIDPDGRTVVIVEVKTRAGDDQAPEWSVHHHKQSHMVRLAARLAQREPYRDRPFRFDAIAVVIPTQGEPIIRHHPGAFQSPW